MNLIIGMMGLGWRATSNGIHKGVERLSKQYGWTGQTYTHIARVGPANLIRKHQGERIILVGNSLGVDAIDDILEANPDLKVDTVFAVVSAMRETFPSNVKEVVRVIASNDRLRNFELKHPNIRTIEIDASHVAADDSEQLWQEVEKHMSNDKPFYIGEYAPLEDSDFIQIANEYGLDEAHVRAVVEVEVGPNGKGSHTSGALVCLYEPHVAYRNTSDETRRALMRAGLAYKNWIRKYPKTSYPRIDQCVDVVESVRGDREAGVTIASLSCSWGLGQILGENYKMCGYSSASEMVRDFARGEVYQLRGMLEFIKSANILDDLKAGRWSNFARRYNGSQFAKHNYHGRLESAYKRWSEAIADRGEIIVINPTPNAPDAVAGDFIFTYQEQQKLDYIADALFDKLQGRIPQFITNQPKEINMLDKLPFDGSKTVLGFIAIGVVAVLEGPMNFPVPDYIEQMLWAWTGIGGAHKVEKLVKAYETYKNS